MPDSNTNCEQDPAGASQRGSSRLIRSLFPLMDLGRRSGSSCGVRQVSQGSSFDMRLPMVYADFLFYGHQHDVLLAFAAGDEA